MAQKAKQTFMQRVGAKLRAKVSSLTHKMRVYRAKRPHRSFRKTDRPHQKMGGRQIPPFTALVAATWRFVWTERRPFLKFAILYGAISYVAVGGMSQLDFVALREATLDVFGGDSAAVGTMFALFGGILGGGAAQAPSEIQQLLGALISFIFWLAIIWFARMRLAGKAVNVRDAFYSCGAPLVSSAAIVVIIVLQLLPSILALFGLMLAQSVGYATQGVEAMMAYSAVALVVILSAYWLAASMMALVVVTLPNMYPWRALSAASELVIGQRWRLALRLGLFVGVIMLIWVIVVALALLFDSWLRIDWLPILPVLMQLLAGWSLVVSGVYTYKLYRSLL